jgi:hypothetical protein
MKNFSDNSFSIPLQGIRERGNNEFGAAGCCQSLINLRESDDSLSAVGSPVQFASMAIDEHLLLIHHLPGADRFLTFSGRSIMLHGVRSASGYVNHGDFIVAAKGDIKGACVCGNFVVVSTSAGLLYLLSNASGYRAVDVADALPLFTFCTAESADLSRDVPSFTFSGSYSAWQRPLSADDVAGFSSAVRAAFNGLAADARSASRFIQPVAVRYAVRLFDDSILWVSPPVLLGVGIQASSPVSASVASDGSHFTAVNSHQVSVASYRVGITVRHGFSSDWDGLVKSIDVLVSPQPSLLVGNSPVSYRCAYSQTGTREYYLVYTPASASVTPSSLLNCADWRVLTSITDFDALRSGKINAECVAKSSDASGGSLSACTFAVGSNSVFSASVGRSELSSVAASMARSIVPAAVTSVNSCLCLGNISQSLPSAWEPALMWGGSAENVPCKAVVTVKINSLNGVSSVVRQFSYDSSPSTIGAVVAYPDSRATSITVDMLRGNFLWHYSAALHPLPESGIAVAVSADMREQSFAVMSPESYVVPPEQNPVEFLHSSISVSLKGNPLVTAFHREVSGSVLAISPSDRAVFSSVFGRYPLYTFSSDGIFAVSFRSSLIYGDVQLIGRHVIASSVLPCCANGHLYFVTSCGSLCSLVGAKVNLVLHRCDAVSMAYNSSRDELWLLSSARSVTVLMSSGATYSRTLTLSSLGGDYLMPVAVSLAGEIYDIATESADSQVQVSFLTYPFSAARNGRLVSPACAVWNVNADNSSLRLSVYGERGSSCHGMLLATITTTGPLSAPLPVRLFSPRIRTLRLSASGTVPSSALFLPVTLIIPK